MISEIGENKVVNEILRDFVDSKKVAKPEHVLRVSYIRNLAESSFFQALHKKLETVRFGPVWKVDFDLAEVVDTLNEV